MNPFWSGAARPTVAAAAALALASCASPGSQGTPQADPSAVAQVIDNVAYYPACGNEILDLDGVSYYPVNDDGTVGFSAPAPEPLGTGGYSRAASGGLLGMVVAPGPGDDVGTLTIYESGWGYFESDSGDIDTWVTTEEQTYNWVC